MNQVNLLRNLVGADDSSICEVWERRACLSPERTFLKFGSDCWSYREAWEKIRRFAGFLQSSGLGGPQNRVASLLSNRPEIFWIWFGTLVTGGVYVGINRRHKKMLLADMLARSRARLLITEQSALPDLPEVGHCGIEFLMVVDDDGIPTQPGYTTLSFSEAFQAEPSQGVSVLPSAAASIIYTSGTTGRSKAVRLPHNAFCRGAARFAEAFGLLESDVFHTWFPLYHIGGQLHATMSTVMVGGAIGLVPTFSARRFWEEVRAMGATVFAGVGGMLTVLWKQPPFPNEHNTTLRLGLCGPIPREIHRPFEQRFGVTLMDQYGMSEAEFITLPEKGSPLGSCGRAGPDYEVAIFDEHDRPRPDFEVGEIVCRPKAADLVFQGYEGDDAATVLAWRNLWFHTGDLGYRDAGGYYYWIDRKTHAIRRRGENISSWELERILHTHPQVAQCAVVGVPSPLGEEDVKAVVVPVEAGKLDAAALHTFCVEQMAHFMVPRYIEFRQTLPLTPTEKVEKEKLRAAAGEVWDAQAQDRDRD